VCSSDLAVQDQVSSWRAFRILARYLVMRIDAQFSVPTLNQRVQGFESLTAHQIRTGASRAPEAPLIFSRQLQPPIPRGYAPQGKGREKSGGAHHGAAALRVRRAVELRLT